MAKKRDYSGFIANPHDKFFKELLSDKAAARDFLQGVLPSEVLNLINLDGLEADADSYVDEDLSEFFADLVFSVPYTHTKQHNITISLLIEHKSFVPQQPVHLQLLQYMLGIWRQRWKDNKPLTPVLPVVFYHGTQRWKVVNFENYFWKGKVEFPEVLKPFLPSFQYLLMDLSTYSEKQVRTLFGQLEVQMGLLLMKKIFSSEIIEELKTILEGVSALTDQAKGRIFIQKIVVYLYSSKREVSLNQIVNKMKEVSTKAGESGLTIAEQLLQEGMEKGIEQGIVRVLKKGVLTVEQIADAFEVERGYVQQLHERAQQGK
jgi:predicted transposase/invertase (TIGR01784 family)